MPECDSVDLVSGLENLNRPVVRQLTNALSWLPMISMKLKRKSTVMTNGREEYLE